MICEVKKSFVFIGITFLSTWRLYFRNLPLKPGNLQLFRGSLVGIVGQLLFIMGIQLRGYPLTSSEGAVLCNLKVPKAVASAPAACPVTKEAPNPRKSTSPSSGSIRNTRL